MSSTHSLRNRSDRKSNSAGNTSTSDINNTLGLMISSQPFHPQHPLHHHPHPHHRPASTSITSSPQAHALDPVPSSSSSLRRPASASFDHGPSHSFPTHRMRTHNHLYRPPEPEAQGPAPSLPSLQVPDTPTPILPGVEAMLAGASAPLRPSSTSSLSRRPMSVSGSSTTINNVVPSPRQRVSVACSFCRTRKLRCTPGPGPCEHCSRRGHKCVFDGGGSGSGSGGKS